MRPPKTSVLQRVSNSGRVRLSSLELTALETERNKGSVRLTSKGESNGAETKRWSYNWRASLGKGSWA